MLKRIAERVIDRALDATARALAAHAMGGEIAPRDGFVAAVTLASLSLMTYAAHRFGASPEPSSRVEASATNR